MWIKIKKIFFLREYAHVRFFLGYTITCDQQWDIFLLSSLSNEKLFNYKVVDLVASYNFRIYFFFPSEVIWKFWKFKIQNLNHVFGCQDNLNWKKIELQSCRSGWDQQLLYRPLFNLRPFEFLKNHVFKYYKSHKGDALWCCLSPLSCQCPSPILTL